MKEAERIPSLLRQRTDTYRMLFCYYHCLKDVHMLY